MTFLLISLIIFAVLIGLYNLKLAKKIQNLEERQRKLLTIQEELTEAVEQATELVEKTIKVTKDVVNLNDFLVKKSECTKSDEEQK